MLKLTKNVYRSHNTTAEESPLMWDFLQHYSSEVDDAGTSCATTASPASDGPGTGSGSEPYGLCRGGGDEIATAAVFSTEAGRTLG